ncbi:MAG: DegV family protein [Actinomycetota bacterium]|jgi:DegV family protein with EDD domain|nr:DegV family protein [Actinomycetota bacterium]
MSKVAIVTDSTSDIPEYLVKELDIKTIPLSVIFGEESFLDNGKDITIKEFYKKIRSSEKLPTTTQPTPKNFIELYSDILKTSDSVISIHISKKMSGTINSAEMAKKEMPGSDIEIIDSECVHMPLGFMVIKAAQLANEGKSKEEILKEVHDLKSKIKVLIVPSTLEYLKKGGRIGKAKGLIASLLEIKPILTIHDGEISQFKTARRWNQAKTELINSMKTMVKNPENLMVSIGDSDAKDDADEMYKKIKEAFNPKKIYRVDIGIVVGSHLGPGGLGITFYE